MDGAGSVDTRKVRWPRRAAASAIAHDTVVFPTPPFPTDDEHGRQRRQRRCRGGSAASDRRSRRWRDGRCARGGSTARSRRQPPNAAAPALEPARPGSSTPQIARDEQRRVGHGPPNGFRRRVRRRGVHRGTTFSTTARTVMRMLRERGGVAHGLRHDDRLRSRHEHHGGRVASS